MRLVHVVITLLSIMSVGCFSKSNNSDLDENFLKGKEFYVAKDFAQASEVFSRIIEANESYPNALLMRGKSYFFSNKIPESLKDFEKILEKDSDNVGGLYWHAKALLYDATNPSKENEEKAKKDLTRILEIDSSHVDARSLLALIYEKQEKYREAFSEYSKVLDEEKRIIDSRANLSILYRKIGMKDKAMAEISTAIEMARLSKIDDSLLLKIREEIAK